MKLIRTTFELITPESAELGDAAERGWIDEEGQDMTPDSYDEEGTTAVDKAVTFLRYHHSYPSASKFHVGVWYTCQYDEDYSTGETEYRSFHLVGFTPEEEELIYKEATKN